MSTKPVTSEDFIVEALVDDEDEGCVVGYKVICPTCRGGYFVATADPALGDLNKAAIKHLNLRHS